MSLNISPLLWKHHFQIIFRKVVQQCYSNAIAIRMFSSNNHLWNQYDQCFVIITNWFKITGNLKEISKKWIWFWSVICTNHHQFRLIQSIHRWMKMDEVIQQSDQIFSWLLIKVGSGMILMNDELDPAESWFSSKEKENHPVCMDLFLVNNSFTEDN